MLMNFIGLAEISKADSLASCSWISSHPPRLSQLYYEKCEIAASLCCAITNSTFSRSRKRFYDVEGWSSVTCRQLLLPLPVAACSTLLRICFRVKILLAVLFAIVLMWKICSCVGKHGSRQVATNRSKLTPRHLRVISLSSRALVLKRRQVAIRLLDCIPEAAVAPPFASLNSSIRLNLLSEWTDEV